MLEVVRLSLRLSGRFLAAYGHLKSPHKFTQPQLMTCLVLRAYLKTTYRGVVDFLATAKSCAMPSASRVCRTTRRSNALPIDRLSPKSRTHFAEIIKECAPDAKEMAVDSTASRQPPPAPTFKPVRAERTRNTSSFRSRFSAEACSLRPGGELGTTNGPREAPEILEKAMAKVRPKKLYADAGYDAEWVHAVCREHWNVESFYSTKCAPQGRFGRRALQVTDGRDAESYGSVGTLKRS